jgi:alkanesulfonate monooxygenase SsuD/methylene tetrahydromethanopterin reductase-like flavin-dependent oxidoreductase (luciferase family)
MRIGILPPHVDMSGTLLDSHGLAERARMIEAAGLDGIWVSDRLPIPGHARLDGPDTYGYLTVIAHATENVEVGSAICIVPLRNPYDLAQRIYTLQTFAPGRVTIGVGTGSQAREYQAAGVEWADRFKLLDRGMEVVHQVFEGREVPELEAMFAEKASAAGIENAYGHWHGQAFKSGEQDPWANEKPWATKVGAPRFLLGAWFSDAQLRRAASKYQGWIASAGAGAMFGGWVKMKDIVKRYRDLGGTRAIATSVDIDLKMPTTPLADDGAFHLRCQPKEASERLRYLEELGFDDVILNLTDHTSKVLAGPRQFDFTMETVQEIRSLLPKDTRSYRDS